MWWLQPKVSLTGFTSKRFHSNEESPLVLLLDCLQGEQTSFSESREEIWAHSHLTVNARSASIVNNRVRLCRAVTMFPVLRPFLSLLPRKLPYSLEGTSIRWAFLWVPNLVLWTCYVTIFLLSRIPALNTNLALRACFLIS